MNLLVICSSFRCECVSVTVTSLQWATDLSDYVKCCVSYSKTLPRECHGTEMQKI